MQNSVRSILPQLIAHAAASTSPEDAERLVELTLDWAIDHCAEYKHNSDLLSWLLGVMSNVAVGPAYHPHDTDRIQ